MILKKDLSYWNIFKKFSPKSKIKNPDKKFSKNECSCLHKKCKANKQMFVRTNVRLLKRSKKFCLLILRDNQMFVYSKIDFRRHTNVRNKQMFVFI